MKWGVLSYFHYNDTMLHSLARAMKISTIVCILFSSLNPVQIQIIYKWLQHLNFEQIMGKNYMLFW